MIRFNKRVEHVDGMVLKAIVVACVLAGGCRASNALEEGQWTGALTPMNHPDMANPVQYDVRYEGDVLAIDVIGPDGGAIATLAPRLDGDTLYFSFHEPEGQVLLECALGRTDGSGFAERCSDAGGKWARFTMDPP